MNVENNSWITIRANYLNAVEKSLCKATKSQKAEILSNVAEHLDNRFRELSPEEKTWENFQTIITEMGPPSDYSELLDSQTISQHRVRKSQSLKVIVVSYLLLLFVVIVFITNRLHKNGDISQERIQSNVAGFSPEQFSNQFSTMLAGFDIDSAGLEEVLNTFGEPTRFGLGQQTFDKHNLPTSYIIFYPCDFQVLMYQGKVFELRFEGPGTGYVFEERIKIGSPLEVVIETVGEPKETVIGKENTFNDGVLYKDIDGKKGCCYYSRRDKNVRLFFLNYKVRAIYKTASDYDASVMQLGGYITSSQEQIATNDGAAISKRRPLVIFGSSRALREIKTW